MTPAQAAWLRKLRDEGEQYLSNERYAIDADRKGYVDKGSTALMDRITPAGLAALAAYEEKVK
jgi:hypothetical protein